MKPTQGWHCGVSDCETEIKTNCNHATASWLQAEYRALQNIKMRGEKTKQWISGWSYRKYEVLFLWIRRQIFKVEFNLSENQLCVWCLFLTCPVEGLWSGSGVSPWFSFHTSTKQRELLCILWFPQQHRSRMSNIICTECICLQHIDPNVGSYNHKLAWQLCQCIVQDCLCFFIRDNIFFFFSFLSVRSVRKSTDNPEPSLRYLRSQMHLLLRALNAGDPLEFSA